MGGKSSRLHSCRYSHQPDRSYGCDFSSNRGSSSFSSSRNCVDYDRRSKLQSKYSRIGDNYQSLEQVTQALSEAGLESSNLIIGIDFTKSNEWTGARSFHHRSLHHLGDFFLNPYEQAISIIGRTLSAFDEDNLIPCYGFGDTSTHDQEVFSFNPDERPCNGFEDVLCRYREIVPHVHLSGPTSFAPIIETAIGIVDNSGGQYHVLMIIADGQVTRSMDMGPDQLSPQEKSTINAIVEASDYPLSIVLVGVGDGPWEVMQKFDDNIPTRAFDNFQFVNLTEITLKDIPESKKETEFALEALMEVPSQYKATLDLQLLGSQRGTPMRFPLPPPLGSISANSYPKHICSSSNEDANRHMWPSRNEHENEFIWSSSNEHRNGIYYDPSPPRIEHSYDNRVGHLVCSWPSRNEHDNGYTRPSSNEHRSGIYYDPSPPPIEHSYDNRSCPVCMCSKKNLAFGCGHQTCYDCGRDMTLCPLCRTNITIRIKLYD